MKSTKFYVPIYRANVTLYLVDNLKVISDKYKTIDLSDYGAVTLENPKHFKKYVVAFESANDYGLIAHEVTHLKNYIFKAVGIKLDTDNDEAEAYLVGFLFDKIYDFLKNSGSRKAKE